MELSIVVAVDEGGVIGRDGDLPWHLSADLQRFKKITMGKPLLMGRRTWESIGRPLPGRRNLVVSRRGDFAAPGAEVFPSIDDALGALASVPEVMVIGGASLYQALLPSVTRLYLTRVHARCRGEVRFPDIKQQEWTEIARETHPGDERNDYAMTFIDYQRP